MSIRTDNDTVPSLYQPHEDYSTATLIQKLDQFDIPYLPMINNPSHPKNTTDDELTDIYLPFNKR